MPTRSLSDRLIAPLRRLAAARDPHRRTDGQLLTAFVRHHDPAAFEAIVRRHGPMVLGVCRRVIGHAARTPTTPSRRCSWCWPGGPRRSAPREQLANFLFGVAYRTALKAQGRLARRRTREKQVDAMPEPAARPDAAVLGRRAAGDRRRNWPPCRTSSACRWCCATWKAARSGRWPSSSGCRPATLANRLAAARRKLAERLIGPRASPWPAGRWRRC